MLASARGFAVRNRLILAGACVICVMVAFQQPSFCKSPASGAKQSQEKHRNGVYEEIQINAPPHVVWKSMQEQRKIDPDSKFVRPATRNGQSIVEQKFCFPSPFGDAECVLGLEDKINERVDFKLLESEDLKAMEGSWTLTPTEDGKGTKLGLSSYVEPYMMVPRMLTNGIISHKAKHNLNMVKKSPRRALQKRACRLSWLQFLVRLTISSRDVYGQ